MHEGGCLCGAVRYRVTNAPFRTGVCHCFALTRGTLKSYQHRSDETGRWPWTIERHTWARSKQHWVPIPPEVEQHEKSAHAPVPAGRN
jgi:hypothetical protein